MWQKVRTPPWIHMHLGTICVHMHEQIGRKATQMSGMHYYNPDRWTDIPPPPSPLVTTSFHVSSFKNHLPVWVALPAITNPPRVSFRIHNTDFPQLTQIIITNIYYLLLMVDTDKFILHFKKFITCSLCTPEGRKGSEMLSKDGWFNIPWLWPN